MKTINKIGKTALVAANVAGIIMMLSEGSEGYWANFAGIALFGFSSWRLGLFRNPHEA